MFLINVQTCSAMIRCAKEATFRYDIDSDDASKQDLLDLETTKVTKGTNCILFFNGFKIYSNIPNHVSIVKPYVN